MEGAQIEVYDKSVHVRRLPVDFVPRHIQLEVSSCIHRSEQLHLQDQRQSRADTCRTYPGNRQKSPGQPELAEGTYCSYGNMVLKDV
jgi:hypothetical protein